MKYIGNIVTDKKVNFDSLINKCKSYNDIDTSVPTLIIGWNNVKSIFPNASILDKEINPNIFWTFGRTERRVDYERDINSFYLYCIKNISLHIKYNFFNVTTTTYSKCKRLINFINSGTLKTIYIHDDCFIFILFGNNVIGISLNDIDYLNIKKEKILNIINKNSNNHVIDNDNFLSIRMRRIIGENKIIIPYLYSIN